MQSSSSPYEGMNPCWALSDTHDSSRAAVLPPPRPRLRIFYVFASYPYSIIIVSPFRLVIFVSCLDRSPSLTPSRLR
ncbi:hypothetical protein FA13DRAFT_1274927 [Coprinellus micaceus]|uniref:Uncharacterized protein n=1 Tax=Coprinellus micaceus TaxID=71717 RepID=A0A4Y7R830_COPMI|nr:hypothetical protein FA13DRAFT_1274927 [Coprinellus micaceus]